MLKYVGLFIVSFLLLAFAISWDYYEKKIPFNPHLAHQIETSIDREKTLLKQEADHLLIDSATSWSSLSFPFFLVEKGKIKKWSRTDVVVAVTDIQEEFEWRLLRTDFSDLLAYKKTIGTNAYLIGVIPLRQGYPLENKYLTTIWNKKIFPIEGIKIFNHEAKEAELIKAGNTSFYVLFPQNTAPENIISVWAVLLAFFIFFAGIFLVLNRLHHSKNYFSGFLLLSVSLAACRIAMVEFLFPERWIKSDFFDPHFFASSSFNASVGDFFLNSLTVAVSCTYLFLISDKLQVKRLLSLPTLQKNTVSVILVVASYFTFLFPNLFVESIFHDSSLLFDINASSVFDSLRIAVLAAFVLGCLSSFFVIHVIFKVFKNTFPVRYFGLIVCVAAGLFILYFITSGLSYWPTLIMGTIFFLFLYYSNYFDLVSLISYRAFPLILVIISCYAFQASWATWQFSEEKKWKAMFRGASNSVANDVLAEYLLSQAVIKIKYDSSVTKINALDFFLKKKQRIISVLSNEYLDRYETNVQLYKADGFPSDNLSGDDLPTVIRRIQNQSAKTTYDGIYLMQSDAQVLKHYVAVVPLSTHTPSGFALIDLSLKRVFSDNVYPELTLDSRFARSIRNKDFSYAFYNNGKMVSQFGEINFLRNFDSTILLDKKLFISGIKKNGILFAGAEDDSVKKIIVAALPYTYFQFLACFSFLFVLGIVLAFIFFLFRFFKSYTSGFSMDYSTKIQVFIYLPFILPLLAVSIFSVQMISYSNEIDQEKEINNMGFSLAEKISAYMGDSPAVHSWSNFGQRWKEQHVPAEADVNLYDAQGALIFSSQSSVFLNQLKMPLVERKAWESIAKERNNLVSITHRIGFLQYSSSFFAVHSARYNHLIGILELPFFESSSDALRVNLLTTILVIFTIIFILFSLIVNAAIRTLTSPLQLIAQRLTHTSLLKNQPIEWNNNDEIGKLIHEYNRMIENLALSKEQLARSQKESAWREIAQQVAHEIKNPLTPMKLTLQQLERLILENSFTKERGEKFLKTLLAQVETLNGIAHSFSVFAAMPKPQIERVNLNELLNNDLLLFQNHALGIVHFNEGDPDIFIFGDGKLLSRIFANLILNGLQSGKDKFVHVEVRIRNEGNQVIISFSDNGNGIPDELIDKIFLPHYTTKESGSGLGLAIAKQGIEQMGGSIWFETSAQGTTFFIQLKNTKE